MVTCGRCDWLRRPIRHSDWPTETSSLKVVILRRGEEGRDYEAIGCYIIGAIGIGIGGGGDFQAVGGVTCLFSDWLTRPVRRSHWELFSNRYLYEQAVDKASDG